jgi:hypothetical protein
MYQLLPVSAQYRSTGVTVQIVSDSIALTLDSVTVHGIDAVVDTWRRLWSGAKFASVARSIARVDSSTPRTVRDSGTVTFSRQEARDTTMVFVAWWRLEKDGWRLTNDSIRSWK